MSQGFAPFYDVNRTYEDNYLQGPFGAFAEVLKSDADADASEQSTQSQPFDQAEEIPWLPCEPAVWHSGRPAAERAFHHGCLPHGLRFGRV